MITAFELACLTLEGNLESEKYKILTVQPTSSFEEELGDFVSYNYDWDEIRVCVGKLPLHSGIVGYLVKMVEEIPTAHNILGTVDAIYEVDITEGENLYYVVWAVTGK